MNIGMVFIEYIISYTLLAIAFHFLFSSLKIIQNHDEWTFAKTKIKSHWCEKNWIWQFLLHQCMCTQVEQQSYNAVSQELTLRSVGLGLGWRWSSCSSSSLEFSRSIRLSRNKRATYRHCMDKFLDPEALSLSVYNHRSCREPFPSE